MTRRLLSAREAALWAVAFLVISALLVATRFTSGDPDSALYAGISTRLSAEPVSRWIAPEWWGLWPEAQMTGLFREHPAGVFLLPAALGRLGIPPEQGAYIVGMGAGLLSLLLVGVLVGRVTSAREGRAVLVLLQLMPVAFIFRIRANHEYPMLACLLVTLVGLDGVRRSWTWVPIVAIGLTAAMLVKGVFVVLVLLGAGWWVVVNPTRADGSIVRPIVAGLVSAVVMLAVAMAYDAWYLRATGETFWLPYWRRQVGPLEIATPLDNATMLASHVLFYLSRLLWHPAPWSAALLVVGWRTRHAAWAWRRHLASTRERGVIFSIGFSLLTVALLSPSSRFAERYAFSATYAVAAAGAVLAVATWPRFGRALERAEAMVPALPAVAWFALALLRLSLGDILPRV
jgi:4-amino-4-deoxy-L-arabinose transferase-like glycosyltransferase